MSPGHSGRTGVRVATSLASLGGIWLYRKYLTEVPVKQVLKWVCVASAVLGLTQLMLVYHLNRPLGTATGSKAAALPPDRRRLWRPGRGTALRPRGLEAGV